MLSRAVRPVGTHVAKRGVVDTMRNRVAMANAARAFASQRAPQHSGGRAGAVARRDSHRRSQPTLMSVFDDLLPFSNDPFFRPLLSSMRAFDRDLVDRDLLHTVNMNLDIAETPKEYVVRAELPGIKKEGVKITFSDGVLTVSAERKEERAEEGEGAEKEGNKDREGHRTHYSDFVYGHVERSLRIPEGADPESIQASMDNGVLTVKIAKSKPQEAKTIQIQ